MSIRRSLALSFAQRYAVLSLALLRTLILSRLLTPSEFGVFVVAQTWLIFAGLLGDVGISVFLVQDKNLSPARLRAAFTMSLSACAAAAVALVGLSIPLSAVLERTELTPVVAIMAASLLAQPFNNAVFAQLQRGGRFGRVAAMGIAGELAGATCAGLLAWYDYGALSLAWGLTVGAFSTMLCALLFARDVFPARLSLRGWRDAWRFGVQSTLTAAMRQIADVVESLMMGRFLGFGGTGLFSRAVSLINYFDRGLFDAVRPVALAALSTYGHEGRDLAEPLKRKACFYAVFAVPAAAFVLGAAPHLVQVMLGDQWSEVVPVLQLLSLTFLAAPISALNFEFYVASNRLPYFIKQEIVVHGARLAAVAVAVFHSPEAVALAWLAARVITILMTRRQLLLPLGLGLRDMWLEIRGGFVIGALCLIPAQATNLVSPGNTARSFVTLVSCGLATLVVWLVGAALLKHPIHGEVQRLVASIARRRPRPA
jgi:O-antigen/teichoic acid export membrane protein